MWISAAVTVGFFSIPTSKMIGYVIPAIPPLAFLVADGLGQQWQNETGVPRKLRWFAVAAILVCLAAVVAGQVANKQSAKKLSQQIAARRQPDEPVYFLKYQFLDVPFYLRLREPVKVFDDWTEFAKVAATHDDWRSSLFDAGEFDPARARQLLVERARLAEVLCAQKVSWVIAKKSSVAGSPAVAALTPFYEKRDRVVFRVTSDELTAKGLCPQMPNAGSSGTSAPPPPPG
jgi:hypothetical protein